MSEYWKSTPKYWCKHCKTYVRDTAFERTQHEATGKHQGNLKRFLRDIHRNNERDERENQKARNEIHRLKGVVSGSPKTGDQQQRPPWKRGLGAGSATGANAEPSASLSANAEQRKRQLAQLVEMGVAIPEEFRGDMALAGDWKVVETTAGNKDRAEADAVAGLNVGVRKRKFEVQEEEEAAGEIVIRKGWGSTTREFPGKEKEEDLDALLERTTELKKKRRETETPDVKAEGKEDIIDGEHEDVAKKDTPSPNDGDILPVKKEEAEGGPTMVGTKYEGEKGVSRSVRETPKETVEEAVPAVVFKKRRPKHAR
ncbi:hypothetical protein RJZ56_005344 [Blastomyces dermatitidis]|uniref:U1 zinc finger domain-containing protein n=3 Tax=Blastomyces TaxID=229219 RepID=A0A179UXK9_BLAGS|nr:U1 zinc finger domain-containing protein [Blastomyces gilchristii SLH14081]XP_045273328.1 U1 zinc finger domain-containing protein [Blastomyces dermatitidis ER-3]EGE82623.1 U1 zinc finger domain-containing protein [Blastomyces dermatitidis ATCC 18188]EQL34477.1 hypothetical protein BDFG_03630 [Blastomyces dermatitidis ATCC 26199]EEQ85617.1 U1 zinc finger domain-containing protein [Blastomyces dermatitidis ER-3]OAT11847.1 U1 zinc finger domain-containing protein [Blastomyces gilchristii SLH1